MTWTSAATTRKRTQTTFGETMVAYVYSYVALCVQVQPWYGFGAYIMGIRSVVWKRLPVIWLNLVKF
jgi:hypothetical protein